MKYTFLCIYTLEYFQIWKSRKRMFNDVTNAILENYPKSKKVLCEEIGIETEKDLNLVEPEKLNIDS